MRFSVAILALLVISAPATAQQPTVTVDDYIRAESFLSSNTAPLVFGATVRPTWLPGDRLWYRNTTSEGTEFVLADPTTGTRAPAFDHARLAEAVSAVVDT
ncbi:MAG: S9 family peptidase, partial [Rhodothermales bacterium]